MVIIMNFDDVLKGNIPEKYKNTGKYILKAIIVLIIYYFSFYLQYVPIKIFHFDTSSYNDTLRIIVNCFANFLASSKSLG